MSAARQQNHVFLGNTSNSVVVEVLGQKIEVQKHLVFEFDNKRKRMSVLLEFNENGKSVFKLYTKGADSAIIAKLANKDQAFMSQVKAQLDLCCKQGLRTLCMAMKILSPQEVAALKSRYIEISKSKDKETLLEGYLEDAEKDLTLIGCSAVEDRIQDEVPETIAKLLEASSLR